MGDLSGLVGILKSFLGFFVDFFFPWVCLICGRANEGICKRCLQAIPVCVEPLCSRCGLPYPSGASNHLCGPCSKGEYPFSKHRSYGLYQGVLEELIGRFKYGGQTFLKEVLADMLFSAYIEPREEVDLIVSVPLSRGRLKERGFDQSLLLAKGLARRFGLQLREGILEKVRETPPQVGLSGKERRQNLKGAFVVRGPETVKGKKPSGQ